MIDVPKPRIGDLISWAIYTEPVAARIDRSLLVIADESDGVPFDVSPITRGAWVIVDGDPEERKIADVVAHAALESQFTESALSTCAGSFAPVWILIVEGMAFDKCFSDAFSKY